MRTNGNNYHTKQRAAVLSYFQRHPSVHLTADELTDALRAEGTSIGRSTIYRALDTLCEAGIIRRFQLSQGEGACYQYIDGDAEICRTHFHLKCLVCGTLYHVDCAQLEALAAHLGKQHNFTVDYAKTVLYGTCEPCRRALAAQAHVQKN